MNDFAVLTNRKRTLNATAHSVVFLGMALHGFRSPKAAVVLHGAGAAGGVTLIAIYLTVASILSWLVSISRCAANVCTALSARAAQPLACFAPSLEMSPALRPISEGSHVDLCARRRCLLLASSAGKRASGLSPGKMQPSLLEHLRRSIPRCFGVRAEILRFELDRNPAYHVERQQYHSSELLQRMQALAGADRWRLIGITGVDLYIPILKYVFGEAQMGRPCAIVSFHRLRQEYYGLDRNDALLS